METICMPGFGIMEEEKPSTYALKTQVCFVNDFT